MLLLRSTGEQFFLTLEDKRIKSSSSQCLWYLETSLRDETHEENIKREMFLLFSLFSLIAHLFDDSFLNPETQDFASSHNHNLSLVFPLVSLWFRSPSHSSLVASLHPSSSSGFRHMQTTYKQGRKESRFKHHQHHQAMRTCKLYEHAVHVFIRGVKRMPTHTFLLPGCQKRRSMCEELSAQT